MPLACYRKAPVIPHYPQTPPAPIHSPRHLKKILPPALITLGSLLITSAVWPIVQYQLFLQPLLKPVTFVSPVPPGELVQVSNSLPPKFHPPQVAGLSASSDDAYIDPQTWFPEADFSPGPKTINSYSLTIPAVNIVNAKVAIDGRDLTQSLIHYPGTALPGESGSPVIFGHSILRQFYNPSIKNPDRYISIFSKIMTLKEGDKIYLDYDQRRFTYEIKDKVEVKPSDVFILEQRYALNELKLITCVPEGTYLRRGVVIARLVDSGPLP